METRNLDNLVDKKNWRNRDEKVERLLSTLMFDNEIDEATSELVALKSENAALRKVVEGARWWRHNWKEDDTVNTVLMKAVDEWERMQK